MMRPARAVIVAIYQATFPNEPDWAEGPLPFEHDGMRADTSTRSGYYPPRTARVLYGSESRPRRWNKTIGRRHGMVEVLGLEAVRLRDEPDAHGLVIVHLSAAHSGPLGVLRALARRDNARLDGFDPREIVDGQATLTGSVPHTLSFVTPQGRWLPRLYRQPKYAFWSATDQWLWALASRSNGLDHPPDPRNPPSSRRPKPPDLEWIQLSADWRGLVLRDGLALVGRRADKGSGDIFYNHAELYVRSIYLDAVLIGLLQQHGISELEEALVAALDSSLASTMPDLEQRVTIFRHELWWQHLSAHGAPNQLLGAHQRQHRLHERFDQVLTEISDFNRLKREGESRYVNNALVLFTLVTVPASLALALLQALGSHNPWIFGIVLAACALLTSGLLFTRTARVVLRSIRKRFTM